jgi:hypothetical protein
MSYRADIRQFVPQRQEAAESGPDLARPYLFELATPTGLRIFNSALRWESEQVQNTTFPHPRQCSANLGKVFTAAKLPNYRGESVAALLDSANAEGGAYFELGRADRKNKAAFINNLNRIYGGHIPVGTILAGCIKPSCWSGQGGERHIAMIGDTVIHNRKEVLMAYHNNWFRPENLNISPAAARSSNIWTTHKNGDMLIAREYYQLPEYASLQYKRQWMGTRWLYLTRDQSGKISDVEAATPEIDDLDPFQYYIHLSIPKEIVEEIADNQGFTRSQETVNGDAELKSFRPGIGLVESLVSDPRPEIFLGDSDLEDRK